MSGPTAQDGYRARAGGVWTREKLIYLAKYAAAFTKAMTPKKKAGKWTDLVFIDLLCGPGKDIIDGVEHPGSPLIALNTLPKFDRLFLGDKSTQNVAALKHRISAEDAPRVDLRAGDCHERAEQIVKDLASWGTLGFAFIDPEGFEVRFDLFATLSQRPIDLLFLFPSGIGIKRNLQQFARSEQCPLDDLWGNREWRQLPAVKRLTGESLSGREAEQVDQSWVNAFCARVATLGYVCHGATRPLRTETNTPMYHLLFFSKDPAGLKIWRGITRIDAVGQRGFVFGGE